MKLKQIPEDFQVNEMIDLEMNGGEYAYFRLMKRNWNTLDAIRKISEKTGIDTNFFGYAGNKDKNAITTQYFSCFKGTKDIENANIEGLKIEYLGNGKERINLGDLDFNEFIIVVRGLDSEKQFTPKKILNLFDDQRFGVNKENIVIGKMILQKKFNEACEKLGVEVEDNSPVNALRKVERKMLRLYLHAYQSYLWNEVVSSLKNEHAAIPLVGFLTKYDGEIKEAYENLMLKEGVKKEDFMIRSYPEMAIEGAERKMFLEVHDLEVKYENDDLNEGKKKATAKFRLEKGQYATFAVKELFKN